MDVHIHVINHHIHNTCRGNLLLTVVISTLEKHLLYFVFPYVGRQLYQCRTLTYINTRIVTQHLILIIVQVTGIQNKATLSRIAVQLLVIEQIERRHVQTITRKTGQEVLRIVFIYIQQLNGEGHHAILLDAFCPSLGQCRHKALYIDRISVIGHLHLIAILDIFIIVLVLCPVGTAKRPGRCLKFLFLFFAHLDHLGFFHVTSKFRIPLGTAGKFAIISPEITIRSFLSSRFIQLDRNVFVLTDNAVGNLLHSLVQRILFGLIIIFTNA